MSKAARQPYVILWQGPRFLLGPPANVRPWTVDESFTVAGRAPRFGDQGREPCEVTVTRIDEDGCAWAVRA